MIFRPSSSHPLRYISTAMGRTISIAPLKVTSDFMVDVLEDWWLAHRQRFSAVQTLLLPG
jgi:hypothetical protein